jgi:hypothetical protein
MHERITIYFTLFLLDQTTTNQMKASTNRYAPNPKLLVLTVLVLVQFWFWL